MPSNARDVIAQRFPHLGVKKHSSSSAPVGVRAPAGSSSRGKTLANSQRSDDRLVAAVADAERRIMEKTEQRIAGMEDRLVELLAGTEEVDSAIVKSAESKTGFMSTIASVLGRKQAPAPPEDGAAEEADEEAISEEEGASDDDE